MIHNMNDLKAVLRWLEDQGAKPLPDSRWHKWSRVAAIDGWELGTWSDVSVVTGSTVEGPGIRGRVKCLTINADIAGLPLVAPWAIASHQ